MLDFARLYHTIDSTTKTNRKLAAMADYFRAAPAADAAWAAYVLSGRKLRQLVPTKRLRVWAAERAGIPDWLFDECYQVVGDLAETMSLLVPPPTEPSPGPRSLATWIETRLLPLRGLDESAQRDAVRSLWDGAPAEARFPITKWITGALRVGVSGRLVTRAIATASGLPPEVIAHRMMGDFEPTAEFYRRLVLPDTGDTAVSQPYPFCLAHPITEGPTRLGDSGDYLAEWKWDGIRAQLIRRGGETFVWSRGEELMAGRWPEIEAAAERLPEGTVLDGEILAVDGVLVYARRGHGKRANLYTDYTFAVWDGDKLVPVANAYSRLNDREIREVDRFVRQNVQEAFGPVRSESMIPDRIDRFPWAGHLGTKMVPQVASLLDEVGSALIFANTRSQTEIWYQRLLAERPDLAGTIAVHHGSLDNSVRGWVERGLREGKLKAVVCTSSLDLGVDFTAVDLVIQIGSPKGAARLLQRAGRSGHQPGAESRLVFVPTHAIVSDAAMRVKYLRGGDARDRRRVVSGKDQTGRTVPVRGPRRRTRPCPRRHGLRAKIEREIRHGAALDGGRMPLSGELSEALRGTIGEAAAGKRGGPELTSLKRLLELQSRWSQIPATDEMLVERARTRSGHHVFVFPFEGRLVHEGLAAVVALRLGRDRPLSLSMACNDYGFFGGRHG